MYSSHPSLLLLISPIFIFLFVAFLIVFIPFKRRNKDKSYLSLNRYYFNKQLLTPAEHRFFHVLKYVVDDVYVINVKVRIADIIGFNSKGLDKRVSFALFAKISQKHFDYVLLDPETYNVVAAIELDDSSHNSLKTRLRDSFVNDLCSNVGLPLYRFKCLHSYNVNDVRMTIFPSEKSPMSGFNNHSADKNGLGGGF